MKLKKGEDSLELEEVEKEILEKFDALFKEYEDKLKNLSASLMTKSGYIINFSYTHRRSDEVFFFKVENVIVPLRR